MFKDRIWLLGGGIYETPGRSYDGYGEVWSSADGMQWHCHTLSAPWNARIYHSVAVFDDRLWILGGTHIPGYDSNDVWFSSDGENWKELPCSPWTARHAPSVFVYRDALWLAAGNHMGSDVWKLTRRPTV